MVEMQGNCPHCGADLERGAMFCAECGKPVARGGDSPEPPAAASASAGAAPPEPAKPENLARTMMGVQAPSLFGNRSPGTPPAKSGPQGAASPSGQTGPQIGPPPSSFGGSGVAVSNTSAVNAAKGGKLDEDEASASRPRVAPTRPGLPLAGPPLAGPPLAGPPLAGPPPANAATEPNSAVEADAAETEEDAAPGEVVVAPLADANTPLAGPAGAGAALGGKTLHGMEYGRDSNNVGAQLAAAVAAAKGMGSIPTPPAAVPAPVPAPAPAKPPANPTPATSASPVVPNLGATSPGSPPFDSMAGTPAEAIAAERPRRPLAKTMLGISPEAALGLQRAAAETPPADPAPAAVSGSVDAPPVAPAPPGRNANPMARTMLGMSNPMASLPPAAAGGTPAAPKAATQGVPIPGPPVAPTQNDRGGMNRTMLGMAPLSASGAVATPGGPAPAAPGGRTMLGVPHSEGGGGAPAFDPRATAPLSQPLHAKPRDTLPPRRENKVLWPLVGVTLVIVMITLYLFVRSDPTPRVDSSAKIVSTETGEALLFEVPSAPEGAKIRFGGQVKPLAAGRASFALAADSLRVGDNLVLADVLLPKGEIAPIRITLAVFYRIWVDTAALRAEKPAIDIVVTALPGTRVTLDGEDLKLDDGGRGVRTYPIDVVSEAKGGVIEHVVRYRVQPPSGDTVVDELRTGIPVAMMQIDRPGREVITDKDSIEIAGATGKDTQLHLDKTTIPVRDGRFLYRLSLPEPGEYKPRLVASAAGKAPFGVTLSIKRVRDLNQAAAQFAAVQDLTYAKLAPNPAIYKGQKISLEGRIYAVDPRGAESVIQMFVRPCPSSRRCPLWVSDPHATEANVDAWIKVLGVVQGEQQFRSEKNEIVTVPKVEAQFVLPAQP